MIGMSGIDVIISQIEQDTQAVCEKIIAEAQAKADKILAEARDQAQSVAAAGKDKTAARVADIKKRGDSAADLEEKRVMLRAKQDIISTMLKKGLDDAKNLPDNEYFALIVQMVEKYSQPEDGIICFGRRDKERMPYDLPERVNSAAKGRLTLAVEDADIDAGFILKYGGIEQNCSFDAIFASEAETLSDRAGKLLF